MPNSHCHAESGITQPTIGGHKVYKRLLIRRRDAWQLSATGIPPAKAIRF